MDHRERLLVTAGIGLALLLRLVFLWHLPNLPLYWDEVHYQHAAETYAHAWQQLLHPTALFAAWREAFDESLQKGEAYSAAVGGLYALIGVRPWAVYLVQALLDTASCLLIYAIARQLGGSSVGLTALALAAVYEPFMFTAARLQTETAAAFVLLAALWAFLSPGSPPSRARSALVGVLIAVAMLIRPAFQYLLPLFLACGVVRHWGVSPRRQLQLMAPLLGGFFLVIAPRLAVTTAHLGHPLWSGNDDPSMNMYAGIVSENFGWRTDHNAFAILPTQGADAPPVGRGAWPSNTAFRNAAIQMAWRHPLASARVVLHKSYQAWSHPYNDSLRTFVTGRRAQRRWHQALLIFAAIGVPLAIAAGGAGLPIVVLALYIWLTYLAVQIEVRYTVTAMPLWLCCAALALVAMARGARAGWRAGKRAALIWPGVGVLVAGWALHGSALGRLVEWWPRLPPATAHAWRVGGLALAVALATLLVARLLRPRHGRALVCAAALFPAALAYPILFAGRPPAQIWHQWSAPLHAGGGVVQQELALPDDLPAPQRAELRLDLQGEGPPDADLVLRINGAEARRFSGGPSRDTAVQPEPFYKEIFAGQGAPARPWHAWYSLPLNASALQPGTRITVELQLEGPSGARGITRVFGDYPDGAAGIFDGPSPFSPGFDGDTSVYKYLGDGDSRMRRQTALRGTASSRFFDGHSWSEEDLSPLPGRQYGRYRIFLLLLYPGGRAAVI